MPSFWCCPRTFGDATAVRKWQVRHRVRLADCHQLFNPMCSMYSIFTYKTKNWVILFGQILVNIPYMEHMGILHTHQTKHWFSTGSCRDLWALSWRQSRYDQCKTGSTFAGIHMFSHNNKETNVKKNRNLYLYNIYATCMSMLWKIHRLS